MNRHALLITLISFIFGIITEDLFPIHWVIIISIWASLIIILLTAIRLTKKKIKHRIWTPIIFIAVFYFSGMLGYGIQLPEFNAKSFTSNFLQSDQLVGEISDIKTGKGNYNSAIVDIYTIVNQNNQQEKAQGKLLCYIRKGNKSFEIGDVIQFQPELIPIQNKGNPGEFNAQRYWKMKGITSMCFLPSAEIKLLDKNNTFQKFWTKSRKGLIHIIQQYISPENQGTVIGLTMGDKSQLSKAEMEQYANAGAMYLLAVAGLHIGILLKFLEWVFMRIPFLRKRNAYLFCAILIVWGVCFLTGMSASVLRASAMFSILAIGQLLGKRYFSLNAIFASAFFLLIIHPTFLFDVGFQLSYAAMIGIGLFYYPLARLYTFKNKILNYTLQGIIVGIAAEIGVVPLCLFYFHQFPNYFLLTNIAVTFLAFAGMVSVVVFLALSFIPFVVNLLAMYVDLIFDVLNGFIHFINSLPAKTSTGFTPSIFQITAIYICILLLYLYWQKKNYHRFGVFALLTFCLSLSLIWKREENKASQKLVVLNNRKKVLFIKENHQLFVVYDANNNFSKKELMFLSSSFQKSTGVEASYIPIRLNQSIAFSSQINITSKKNGIFVTYYHQNYILANSDITDISRKSIVIKGAWNPFITTNHKQLNTLQHAVAITPKNT